MVNGFWIIWILHFVCFGTAILAGLVNRKKNLRTSEEEGLRTKKLLYIWLSLLAVYLLIRYTTGWRITGWYGEAIAVLSVFAYFDYSIIYKSIPPNVAKVRDVYTLVRTLFLGSMIIRVLIAFFMVLLLSPQAGYYSLPLNRSLGEKYIQGNVYFYLNMKKGYVFKRRIFLFEKDILLLKIAYNNIISISGSDPITGYIYKWGNELYIHGSGYGGGYISSYLLVTILPGNKMKIEHVRKYTKGHGPRITTKKLHGIINY